MTEQTPLSSGDQINEQNRATETASKSSKKQFVEPTVSVPADVLEATTFFQAPTIESATT